MSNKLCGRKTTKQNDFTLWNHSWLLSFCLVSLELSSPSQKWRAFPQTSAERFTFLPAFESNVPFLSAMSHILKLSSKRHRLKPFEVGVKTANNLYCIVLSAYIPIQFAMPTPKSFALWRILHGLTDRLRLNCEPSSPINAFSHILKLNSGSQDWRPLPDMSADLFQVPCVISVQWFSPKRSPSYPRH